MNFQTFYVLLNENFQAGIALGPNSTRRSFGVGVFLTKFCGVVVLCHRGRVWNTHSCGGVASVIKCNVVGYESPLSFAVRFLKVEQALYLMDAGTLIVYWDITGKLLSSSNVKALTARYEKNFVTAPNAQQYVVYKSLRDAGFIVSRLKEESSVYWSWQCRQPQAPHGTLYTIHTVLADANILHFPREGIQTHSGEAFYALNKNSAIKKSPIQSCHHPIIVGVVSADDAAFLRIRRLSIHNLHR